MRIGIDASNIRGGGGLIHLKELLAAAKPEEHGIDTVTVWGNHSTLKTIDDRRWLKKIRCKSLEKGIMYRLHWQRFRLPVLAQELCDLLFVPGGNNPGGFKPYVAMSQNILPFDKYERRRYGLSWTRFRYFLLSLGQAKTFREAAGNIFLNHFSRQTVEGITGKLPSTAIVPHGINSNFRIKPRLQQPKEDFTIGKPFRWLYVSIINLYKHQWHIVSALDMLAKKGYQSSLDLVGPAYPTALDRLLKGIAKLPRSKSEVRYHGTVEHDKLKAYYQDADGFIFASSCENMPIILLEAMTAGLPIACSNRGPMPEILRDAGVYFNPESPEQIADAMTTLMDDPKKRTECAARAFDYASKYTWTRCASETFIFIARVGRQCGNKQTKTTKEFVL